MLFAFISCLAPNLAGDSVYPNSPKCTDILEDDMESNADSQDFIMDELYDLTFVPSDSAPEGSIDITIQDSLIDVVHAHVALSCDMSQYEPEIFAEDLLITILYMPLESERDCYYNVEFSMDRPFEPGTYTLQIMEDTTDFLNEY